MTQNLSANKIKALVILGSTLLAIIAISYIAGGIFTVKYGGDTDKTTPWMIYQFWAQYQENPSVMQWVYISFAGAALIVLAPLWLFFAPAKRSLHGDARFAKKSEIEKAGLFGERGIIVGKLGSKYMVFGGAQHAIISAPTRSGKGVGIVIPNLLNWSESLVVLDIKQENWDITAGYRAKHGQACFLFNPAATDYRTHRYNPLSYISNDPNFRIDDTQKIANMLFPDQPGTDVIWTATPRMFFVGVVLYLIETPGKLVTLGQVLRESLNGGDGAKYFAEIMKRREETGKPLSSACTRALNSYCTIDSDNTRSGIIGGFRSRLELFANPLVDAATSANDFDLRDIRKKRMSIYLGVTPDNLDRMAPLLNLFFQQLIDLNTRELPESNPALKFTCLLMMDEFTAMGKVHILSKGISYIAGYKLRMLPIIQSPAQLVEVYGKEAAQTFTTNHALQIVFPPKASDIEVAEAISKWLGNQTVDGKSTSKQRGIGAKTQRTESISDQRRALLLPQEITALGQSRELVIAENIPPILADKVIYHQDPAFVDRLKSVSPMLAAIKGNPSHKQLSSAVQAGQLSAPVPMIDLEAFAEILAEGETASAIEAGKLIVINRPVTLDDLPNLSSMSIKHFAKAKFDKIERSLSTFTEAELLNRISQLGVQDKANNKA